MSEHTNSCKTAVLILNYNGAQFIDDCVRSLLKISADPFTIFLIDNCSSDDSVALTRTRYPMVRLIETGENLGFAAAYDQVIRQLDYEYFVLLNVDTVVDENWLNPLLQTVDGDRRVGACGSKIIHLSDRKTIDHAGGMLTLIGAGLDIGKWEIDGGRYDRAKETGFACGCSLLVRKAAYLEVGGFDPKYFMYHEDVDLCWKLRMFGHSVVYVPGSTVYHHIGMGIQQAVESPFKTYHCQKNRIANIVKNLAAKRLAVSLFVSTAYDVVRIAGFIRSGRPDLMKAVLMGYRGALGTIGDLLRQRRALQRRRLLSDAEISRFFSPVPNSAAEYRRIQKVRNREHDAGKHEANICKKLQTINLTRFLIK